MIRIDAPKLEIGFFNNAALRNINQNTPVFGTGPKGVISKCEVSRLFYSVFVFSPMANILHGKRYTSLLFRVEKYEQNLKCIYIY